MNDYFFLNIQKRGYTLARVGETVELDCDLADTGNYEPAQAHLVAVFSERAAVGPHFCVVRTRPEFPAVVAYGVRLNAVDQHERPGLVFFHGVETSVEHLPLLVVRLLRWLGAPALRALDERLGRIAAVDPRPAADFLRAQRDAVAASIVDASEANGTVPPSTTRPRPIGSIRCDVDTASAAWLTMAVGHVGLSGPWRIVESGVGDRRSISSDHASAEGSVLLSDLLLRAASAGSPLDRRDPPERAVPAHGVLAELGDQGDDPSVLRVFSDFGLHSVRATACVRRYRDQDYYMFMVTRFSVLEFGRVPRIYWIARRDLDAGALTRLDRFYDLAGATTA